MIATLLACSDGTGPANEPDDGNSTTALKDFPYDDLGAGKFVFNDAGWMYLVDSRARKTTATALGTMIGQGLSGPASPDGKVFLLEYSAVDNQGRVQWLIGTRDWGGHVSEIYRTEPNGIWYSSWSYDGGSIFFTRVLASGPQLMDIRRITTATGAIQTINPNLDQKCAYIFGQISESIDGSIAFPAQQLTDTGKCVGAIYTMRQDGSQKRVVFQDNSNPEMYRPVWSPDGKSIAFARRIYVNNVTADRTQTTITIVNADGSNARTIATVFASKTVTTIDDAQLCWSSDGTHLLFPVVDQVLGDYIYSVTTDGARLTRVAPGWFLSCVNG